MQAIRLKTEYLTNPIGIDCINPRLFWNCKGGNRQTAYELNIKNEDNILIYETGKVLTNKMYFDCPIKLEYKQKYMWSVRLYDEKDCVGKFSSACFELGLDPNKKWQANWITGNYFVNPLKRYKVDYFKKEFVSKRIKKARLYITACGLYCASINGQKVGDGVLTPGISDYRKRIQYQTYDITNLILEGNNTINVELTDGWYRGSCGAWGIRNQYGFQTKLIAILELTDFDDEVKTVVTDDSWLWSNDGEIIYADNKDGEIVDARLVPTYSNKARTTGHNVIPTCSNNSLITEHECFKPELIITPSGKRVLNFKQNFAGYISFRVNAKENDKLTLLFGELLDNNSEFTQNNIQLKMKNKVTPLQKIEYTCKEGINEYKTKFAIFGYQYVLVDTNIEFDPSDFEGIALYTDMEETGTFSSSNELLNQFVRNVIWSTKSNSADLPTDCPTRERHGWTGDAQIFADTFSYLFDVCAFEQKYLNDIYDFQKPNGKLPHIAPIGGSDFYMDGMNGSTGWADAGIIIPYTLYKKYQDERILKKYLKRMEKYIEFMKSRCGQFYITAKPSHLFGEERRYLVNSGQSYGEWAEPSDVHKMTWVDCAIPHPESSTAYTIYMLDLMSEIEEVLGYKDKAKEYKEFSNKCRKSYQALIDKNPEYSLDTDRQANLVRPLAFKLLNLRQEEFTKKRLIKALDNYDWRIGTGFLSTPLILDVLNKIDREYAYRLLENTKCPGWLNMAKNSTTIWEAWEGKDTSNGGIASLNHYSKGAMCSWLFKSMCGIDIKSDNHFEIKPLPGGNFTYAKASYKSIYGEVISEWKKTSKGYEYSISIPSNTSATIMLPNGKTYTQNLRSKHYES